MLLACAGTRSVVAIGDEAIASSTCLCRVVFGGSKIDYRKGNSNGDLSIARYVGSLTKTIAKGDFLYKFRHIII